MGTGLWFRVSVCQIRFFLVLSHLLIVVFYVLSFQQQGSIWPKLFTQFPLCTWDKTVHILPLRRLRARTWKVYSKFAKKQEQSTEVRERSS